MDEKDLEAFDKTAKNDPTGNRVYATMLEITFSSALHRRGMERTCEEEAHPHN